MATNYVQVNSMRTNRLQNARAALDDAMREVNAAIEEMRREYDPLASNIFVSRCLSKTCPTPRAGSGITCRRGSVGSRRAILGFAATSGSGSNC